MIYFIPVGGNNMKNDLLAMKALELRIFTANEPWEEHLDWIREFIVKYYKGNEEDLFELEDFIQEAMLLLYQNFSVENFTKEKFFDDLKRVYSTMKKTQEFSKPILGQDCFYVIALEKLELPLLVQRALRVLPNDKKILVAKKFGLQNTQPLTSHELSLLTDLPISSIKSRLSTSLNMLYKTSALNFYRQPSVEEVYTPYQRFIYSFAIANIKWNVCSRQELDRFFYQREVSDYVATVYRELAKSIYKQKEYKAFYLSFKNDWDYIQEKQNLSRKRVYF